MLRSFSLGLLLSLLASSAWAARSGEARWHAQAADVLPGRHISVALIDRSSGQPLPLYAWRGQRFAPGIEGEAYAVRLTNHSQRRVLVVLAVDGVNVITGRNAAALATDGGYVLEAGQTTDIAGWRKSSRSVAQFYFTDPGDSYAGRTGRAGQVGVIGAAVFTERSFIPAPPPVYSGRDAQNGAAAPKAASGARSAESAQRQIGTGHGQREWAPVTQTDFIAATRAPSEVLRIDYDTPEGLMQRGIRLQRYERTHRTREPAAFPGQYVPDPRD